MGWHALWCDHAKAREEDRDFAAQQVRMRILWKGFDEACGCWNLELPTMQKNNNWRRLRFDDTSCHYCEDKRLAFAKGTGRSVRALNFIHAPRNSEIAFPFKPNIFFFNKCLNLFNINKLTSLKK